MKADGVAKHVSRYRDRIKASGIASAVLMSRRELEPVVRQTLEAVVFQKEPRVDVLEWTKRIASEGGAVAS
jgi:hypothetical protein